MDAKLALRKLSEQASKFTDVLDGGIELNLTSRRPLTTDTADLYQGVLLSKGAKVAVKSIHAGPPSSQEAIEVSTSVVSVISLHALTYYHFVAYFTGNTHLVKAPP